MAGALDCGGGLLVLSAPVEKEGLCVLVSGINLGAAEEERANPRRIVSDSDSDSDLLLLLLPSIHLFELFLSSLIWFGPQWLVRCFPADVYHIDSLMIAALALRPSVFCGWLAGGVAVLWSPRREVHGEIAIESMPPGGKEPFLFE